MDKYLILCLLFILINFNFSIAQTLKLPERTVKLPEWTVKKGTFYKKKLEIGFCMGTAHYLGDLGGALESTRFNFGIFARWSFDSHFSARLGLNYLQISGDDRFSGKKDVSATESRIDADAAWFRYYRNLNFRTHMFDAGLAFEVTPYNFQLGSGRRSSVLSPYGFLGIGLFAFNPEGFYNGLWIELKPLSTEGQGLVPGRAPYELVQMNVPMGVGVKVSLNNVWSIGLEFNYRLTYTDYLDDVSTDYVEDESIFNTNFSSTKAAISRSLARRSGEIDPSGVNSIVTAPGEQRGDPKDNDAYYTVTIRFSCYIGSCRSGYMAPY